MYDVWHRPHEYAYRTTRSGINILKTGISDSIPLSRIIGIICDIGRCKVAVISQEVAALFLLSKIIIFIIASLGVKEA